MLGGGLTTVDIVDNVGEGSAVAGIPGLCFFTNSSISAASSPISLSSYASFSWTMGCWPGGVHAFGLLVLIVLVVESVALQAVCALQMVVVQLVVSVESGVTVLARQNAVQVEAVLGVSQSDSWGSAGGGGSGPGGDGGSGEGGSGGDGGLGGDGVPGGDGGLGGDGGPGGGPGRRGEFGGGTGPGVSGSESGLVPGG